MGQRPVPQRDQVPLRFGQSEAREGQRDAGNARQTERQRRQGARQLPRPRVHRGAILGADDLQRVEKVMDDEVRGADNEAGNDEGDDHGRQRGIVEDRHQRVKTSCHDQPPLKLRRSAGALAKAEATGSTAKRPIRHRRCILR